VSEGICEVGCEEMHKIRYMCGRVSKDIFGI